MDERISARLSLWIISFLGFAIQYMLLMDFNIAITDMVNRPSDNDISTSHEWTRKRKHGNEKFDWNEKEEALVLGASYWILWMSHPVGGVMSYLFSAKTIFGTTILLGCGLNLFIPTAISMHFKLLLIVRMVQGFVVGSAFPAIIPAMQFWIPAAEKNRFLTCYLGINFGSAVTYFISGYTIELYDWETVFYVNGIIGLAWWLAWNYFMYDTPGQHPRISESERLFISSRIRAVLADRTQAPPKPIPWLHILTSVEFIVNCVAQFAVVWTLLLVNLYVPKYMKLFHNLDSSWNGIISGIPHLIRIPITIAYAALADQLINRNAMSVTNVRKLSVFLCLIVPAFSLIILAYRGNTFYVAFSMFLLTTAISGTTLTGTVGGMIDISPTFSGVMQGLTGLVSHMPGFIVPTIVGQLTLNNDTIEQWGIVFLISAAISFVAGISFLIFWNSDVKEWDDGERHFRKSVPANVDSDNEVQLEKLNV